MQVKYIVYYPQAGDAPKVALWLTSDGSMLHSKYATEHNINPQLYSSLGYAYYSPRKKKYQLDHYSCGATYSLLKLLKKRQLEKRDKLLVLKEIEKNPLFKNPQVQQGTYRDYQLFLKAQEILKIR